MGPHAAHYTIYVPITMAVTKSPTCLSTVYQGVFDESTAFWAYRKLAFLAQAKFSYVIAEIQQIQKDLEEASEALLRNLENQWMKTPNGSQEFRVDVTTALTDNADHRESPEELPRILGRRRINSAADLARM